MIRHRSKEGSISLFLVIIIIAVLTLQSVYIQAAKLRDLELRAARVADLSADLILASYSTELAETYGLLAYEDEVMPGDLESYIDDELEGLPATYQIRIEHTSRFSDSVDLRDQISTYMKIIYPQIMLKRILDETELLSAFFQSVAGDDDDLIEADKTSGTKFRNEMDQLLHSQAMDIAITSFKQFLNEHVMNKPNNILRAFFKDLNPEETSSLNDEELAEADQALNQLNGRVEGVSWDPSDIMVMLSEGIDLLNFETNDLYDRLLTIEYSLNMSHNWQDQRARTEGKESRENLRGLAFTEIPRQHELESEYILTGFDREWMAKTSVSTMINSTRLAIRVLSLLQNESEMQSLAGLANILTIAIAAVSAGSILIEAEALKYVLVFLRAQIDAIKDVNSLLDGESVKLIPYTDQVEISSVYIDYLRLFYLVGNQERQLERLAECIEMNVGGPLYTAFQLEFEFTSSHPLYKDFRLTRRASYLE